LQSKGDLLLPAFYTCVKPMKQATMLYILPLLAGVSLLIPFLLFAGCTGQAPDSRLEGTGWTLTGYVTNGTPGQVPAGTSVTIDFGNGGSLTGSAGCNHYFASYEAKGTTIAISQAGSTLMYCTTPGVMEQESSYLSLLGQVKTFMVEGDRLVLADGKGIAILLFAKTVPPVPESFAGTNWTLESFHSSDAASSVISGTSISALFGDDGQVTGSAGCNSYFASYTLSGITLTIGEPGSTKKYCTTPEGVMPQENTYLANLGQARTFAIQGTRMSLADANGTTLLSFTKSALPE